MDCLYFLETINDLVTSNHIQLTGVQAQSSPVEYDIFFNIVSFIDTHDSICDVCRTPFSPCISKTNNSDFEGIIVNHPLFLPSVEDYLMLLKHSTEMHRAMTAVQQGYVCKYFSYLSATYFRVYFQKHKSFL